MSEYDPKQKTELFDVEEHDRYLLRSTPEIVRVLRDLSKKLTIITAYFNNSGACFLTSVLAVLPEREMVVLDCSSDEKLNEQALKAEQIVCVTRQDQITVRFTCNRLQRAKYQGETVFATPLPESVYRPQRREFFRVITPAYNPLVVRVPRPDGPPLELAVVDLGGGGASLLDLKNHLADVQLGTTLERCRLELPGFGPVTFDLVIRNAAATRLNDGAPTQRFGCQFKSLPIDAYALIQRYLHKLQLEAKR